MLALRSDLGQQLGSQSLLGGIDTPRPARAHIGETAQFLQQMRALAAEHRGQRSLVTSLRASAEPLSAGPGAGGPRPGA